MPIAQPSTYERQFKDLWEHPLLTSAGLRSHSLCQRNRQVPDNYTIAWTVHTTGLKHTTRWCGMQAHDAEQAAGEDANLCAGFWERASHSSAFMRGPPSRSARSKSMGLSCTLGAPLRGPCRAVPRFSAKSRRTATMSARAAVSAASVVATSWQDIHSTRASSPANAALATCNVLITLRLSKRPLVQHGLHLLHRNFKETNAKTASITLIADQHCWKHEGAAYWERTGSGGRYLWEGVWLVEQGNSLLEQSWQPCPQYAGKDAVHIRHLHTSSE